MDLSLTLTPTTHRNPAPINLNDLPYLEPQSRPEPTMTQQHLSSSATSGPSASQTSFNSEPPSNYELGLSALQTGLNLIRSSVPVSKDGVIIAQFKDGMLETLFDSMKDILVAIMTSTTATTHCSCSAVTPAPANLVDHPVFTDHPVSSFTKGKRGRPRKNDPPRPAKKPTRPPYAVREAAILRGLYLDVTGSSV